MPNYVQKYSNDDTKFKIEFRTESNEDTICLIYSDLLDKAFNIIDGPTSDESGAPILDSNGDPVIGKIAVLDVPGQAAKEAAAAQDLIDRQAAKDADAATRLAIKALKAKAKDKSLKADEIQDMLEKITDILGL